MDAPLAAPDSLIRPWRRATIVASLIAALELVALLGAGVLLLARPLAHVVQRQAEVHALAPAKHAAPPIARTVLPTIPTLSRGQTGVLVLNGNGRAGAASAEADRLRGLGYLISGTGNAARHDFASTVVMFRPGFHAEALRLARDLRLKIVGPLDGLRPGQLMGAHVVVLLGAA